MLWLCHFDAVTMGLAMGVMMDGWIDCNRRAVGRERAA